MTRAVPPADWLAAALDPPRAGGPPPVQGRLREVAEDFEVEERLGFDPDGGAAGELEVAALANLGDLVTRLAGAGVEAARRPLRLPVQGLQWQVEGDTLSLSFELGRGAFATAVVRELVAFDSPAVPALPE